MSQTGPNSSETGQQSSLSSKNILSCRVALSLREDNGQLSLRSFRGEGRRGHHAPRPHICISDWHSIRIGIKGVGSWFPWIWAFHAFWLIAPTCKAVTRAAVYSSCPPLHCGWCNSGFIHQSPWIATSSSRRQTCCRGAGAPFACMRCPAKRSVALRLPTDRQPVWIPSLISFLVSQIICVLLRFHAQSITNFFDMFLCAVECRWRQLNYTTHGKSCFLQSL